MAQVEWVNTFIGTGGSGRGPEYGGTMPLVTTPFGMTNWTAQTRQNRISVSSYAYEDGAISGFATQMVTKDALIGAADSVGIAF